MKKLLGTGSFINNEWAKDKGEGHVAVRDKYNHSLLSEIAYADLIDMNKAIEGAKQAQKELASYDAGKRASFIFALRDELKKEAASFAALISTEAGKPIDYATAEVSRCITTLTIAGEEATRHCGETVAMDFSSGIGKDAFTKRYPLGVIGCISPFNFPLNLALHKIAPALAVGCSVVLKPSPYAPLSALAFAALAKKVGLPSGSINVVICDVSVAESMVKDARIKMLSFTGSPAIGWHLKSIAGKKKVILELGGNAACIIDRTADLDDAAKKVANGAFLYAGQICISTQRVYVDAGVYDDFIEKLVDETKKVRIGNPSEPGMIVGPLIDKVHLLRIKAWVEESVSMGAKVLFGGEVLDEGKNLFMPTLLTNTNSGMKVNSEEVFGPIAIVEKVSFFDEAITKVNESRYGLQVGLFTNQIAQMKYSLNKLEVGAVIINNVPGFRIDNMPYGGVKESGLGREGVKYAMDDMTEPRLLIF